MILVKQTTSKDATIYSYEDSFSPPENFQKTDKLPVGNPNNQDEQKFEQVFDIGGFSLTPPVPGANTVLKLAIDSQIGPTLVIVTLFLNGFVDFQEFGFWLQEGHNEISLFSDVQIDQASIVFSGLLGGIVGGWVDDFYQVWSSLSAGGLLVP